MQNRKRRHTLLQKGMTFAAASLLIIMGSSGAYAAFDSGGTCIDTGDPDCLGAFSPTVNTVIDLPADGILDYTTFTVPAGVTVTFNKNAANTPVVIRATGNVSIQGTISLSGTAAKPSGTAGNGNLGDDGQPGVGGPGGYDGGLGGLSPLFGGSTGAAGGGGHGPGGGQPAPYNSGWPFYGPGAGGGGGSFGTAGAGGYYGGGTGSTYGQLYILPLVGGSGGGGGGSGSSFNGGGGGGGGGAILITSSGTINMSGSGYVLSDGGIGANSDGDNCGGGGGGGSGGAIRLVAEAITRANSAGLYARAGAGGGSCRSSGGAGGKGIIRIEANTITWSGNTDPVYTFGTPGKLFVPSNPTLAITQVAGNAVPANPTGSADITLAQGTTMPVTVDLAATNIPRGTTVTVYVVPTLGGVRTSVLSTALDGLSDAATTATTQVTLIDGNNTLLATATFTVTELASLNLPTFEGERVAKIRVESMLNGGSQVVYITASGKEYPK